MTHASAVLNPIALRQQPVMLRLAMVCLAALGCSKPPSPATPPLHPASGRVTVGGTPAPGLTLPFHPSASGVNVTPTATAGPDGSFTVSTFSHSDGAPEGEYRVAAVWLESNNPGGDDPQIDRLKGRFADPARNKLTVTIKPETNTLAPINLR